MVKRFYKHKTLIDEQLYHRHLFPLLNEHFDVKHIRDDLHLDSLPDPQVYDLAVKQGRIILTTNVKHFRPLLRDDCPGIIGIPGAWLWRCWCRCGAMSRTKAQPPAVAGNGRG